MAQIRADGIAVYVFRRNPGLEFLQIRRSDTTGEYQQSWQIVYGGIEKDESALHAAIRELKEEIGITPAELRDFFQVEYVETFYFRPHDYVLMMPVFAAEITPDANLALNDEHDASRWIPAAEVDQQFMWRTQREALQYLMAELANPSLARRFLTVNLEKLRAGQFT